MDKEFTFENKETYTHEDVQGILKGHRGYLKVDELKETNGKLVAELKPYKAQERNSHIVSLIPDSANKDMSSDIISLAKITDDDDDDVISSKLKKAVDEREWLQKKVVDDKSAKSVETFKKVENKKEEPKNYRFMKGN